MFDDFPSGTVEALQAEGILRVEDGNHGNDRPRSEEFGSGVTAFIRAADMDGGRIMFDTAEKINDVALRRIRKGKGRPGDILFSSKGTVGKLARTSLDAPPFVCSPQTTYWRVVNDDKLDRAFLYFFMCSPWFIEQWEAIKGETDMADYASLTAQRRFKVPLPPMPFQKRVVSVLEPLDDKIEMNRQMSRTLEETVSALFRSWFVDFDPVVAKAAGRPPAHLSPALAALFPGSFQDSELGPIPKGWSTSTVAGAVSLIIDHRGKTPTKLGGDWVDAGIPAVSAKNVKSGRLVNKSAMGHITEELYLKWMRDELEAGDVLMTSEAPLGELLYLPEKVKWCQSQRLFGLRANRDVCLPSVLYGWLSTLECQAELDARSSGTTVMGIRQSELRTVPVLLPKMSVQQKYDEIVGPMLLQLWHNESESENLAALRDTLLPKLLSGELRVKLADKLAGVAT